ncbi:hypothetical protein GH5_00045 [Leishmania sp. Ghana 2012 LV757]|uniref:Uncharacterized protein n=1 Tax=Leishmania orientalis TaxID=2249476 RepID=A0A836FZ91_9TRYP|nr:hypothetical protein LSCM4_00036 [Leishmania orientalis]KAG5489183.1 hypothetical protein GH5_00045 [Leishmania sp. Ghana 2012 LV757]
MDFEGLLTNEALRPLLSEFALHLMDHSDTASLIARLPPPKTAMLYHAALLRCPTAATTKGERLYQAERLCASVLDAYGLRGGTVKESTPRVHGACTRPVCPMTASDGAAEMTVCPALCRRLAEVEVTHPLLEEALAAREARLQHHIATMFAGAPPSFSTSQMSPSTS